MLEYKVYVESEGNMRLSPSVKIKWPDNHLLIVDMKTLRSPGHDVLHITFEPKSVVSPETEKRYAAALLARTISALALEYTLRREVRRLVLHILASKTVKDFPDIYNRLLNAAIAALQPINSRYQSVARSLYGFFLQGNDTLFIRGFVRFRLKEVTLDIRKACEQALRVLEAEKEYQDFIKLLRRFVEMQTPQASLVHIKVGQEGACSLLDEHMQPIALCSPGLAVEMMRHELTGEDMIISSLITLAPRQIQVHHAERAQNKRMLDTISRVFYGRVRYL